MSTPYITNDRFRTLTAMPSVMVDRLEAMAPGWLAAKLTARSRWIDSRLAKRYATPFGTPVPEAVEDWLTRIVTLHAYIRHGVDQLDEQFQELKADATKAEDEIKEAAEATNGLFDLPLRADASGSAISKGAPYVYSERSPTLWTKIQARRGREERARGRGTDA
ncbi:MAG: DUF1320 family protein [Deltaproteobacteria bacterium]|nr:DUF1320 family protein [Deltaproteobacteria bacterium]